MAKNKILYIVAIVLILVVIAVGLFLFLGNKEVKKEVEVLQMVNCNGKVKLSKMKCFLERADMCFPVTVGKILEDGKVIELTVLRRENGKCYFQGKINNVVSFDCYFSQGTFTFDVFLQMLGTDRGLQKIVDDACWQNSN